MHPGAQLVGLPNCSWWVHKTIIIGTSSCPAGGLAKLQLVVQSSCIWWFRNCILQLCKLCGWLVCYYQLVNQPIVSPILANCAWWILKRCTWHVCQLCLAGIQWQLAVSPAASCRLTICFWKLCQTQLGCRAN